MPSVEIPAPTENSPVELLLDLRHHDHPVGRRARFGGDGHGLEELEVTQLPLGAVDHDAVVGVTFGEIELAADDIVARLGVAEMSMRST